MKLKIDWRNLTDVRFVKRFMGLYESPEEILACAYHCNTALIGKSDRVITRFCSSDIYIYAVLMVS